MNFIKFEREFDTAELNREKQLIPGRVLRASDGGIALIGHMNEVGGACDDCGYGGSWIEYSDELVALFEGPPEKKS